MDQPKEEDSALMHDFGGKKSLFTSKLLGLLLVVAVLGIGTGYLLAQNAGEGGLSGVGSKLKAGVAGKGATFGEKYSDEYDGPAEGLLKEGGIDGEGQYHIERGESETQWVYLTSQTIDLSQFVNKNVKVWGETHKALKAPWLMDVTGAEVL